VATVAINAVLAALLPTVGTQHVRQAAAQVRPVGAASAQHLLHRDGLWRTMKSKGNI